MLAGQRSAVEEHRFLLRVLLKRLRSVLSKLEKGIKRVSLPFRRRSRPSRWRSPRCRPEWRPRRGGSCTKPKTYPQRARTHARNEGGREACVAERSGGPFARPEATPTHDPTHAGTGVVQAQALRKKSREVGWAALNARGGIFEGHLLLLQGDHRAHNRVNLPLHHLLLFQAIHGALFVLFLHLCLRFFD